MPAVDTLQGPGLRDGAYSSAALVTPHDTNELAAVSRALYVGTTGNVRVLMQDGQDVIFSTVPVGWHRLRVKKVFATSTTASNIVAVW